jgi:signal transduction histidine kinase
MNTVSLPAGVQWSDPLATAEFLGELPLLAGLSTANLVDLVRRARQLSVPAGEFVIREGSPGDGLYLLLDGELEVTRREGERDVVLAVYGPGVFLGEMSLVEQAPRSASIRSISDSSLLVIEPADFHRLLQISPAASATVLRTVVERLRRTEASLIQNAHLASLGTLAAGLAHELNNPAAALQRGLPQLREVMFELERCAEQIGRLGIQARLAASLDILHGTGAKTHADTAFGIGTQRAEDELLDWLDARGTMHAVALAPHLVAGGWSPSRLQRLLDGFDEDHAESVLRWLAARCAATAVTDELVQSAAAISEIVAAVKAHSALGQSAIREYDVVQGLESTLVILRGRLRGGITVIRDYAADRPRIEAYGGELNRVWANLIANAIDATAGSGTLEIRIEACRDGVAVRVTDDGSGIPEAIQPRIFDPFFTTKQFGAGTGLGLHTAYSIVRRHGGTIGVDSKPGRTAFTVELPLRIRHDGTTG